MTIGKLGETFIKKRLSAALENSEQLRQDIFAAYTNFKQCNWGISSEEDVKRNDNAVMNPDSGGILARYPTVEGDIILKMPQDRSYLMIMFCDEY